MNKKFRYIVIFNRITKKDKIKKSNCVGFNKKKPAIKFAETLLSGQHDYIIDVFDLNITDEWPCIWRVQ